VDDTARITLACLDLAGTSVADGGVVEKAFAEALATQGVVRGTEAYGRSMSRVQAARGQSKLDVFRQIFSDEDRARAANHSFERAYDSIIDRDGLTPIPGAEAAMDKLTGSGVRICLMTGFGRATLGRVIDTGVLTGAHDRTQLEAAGATEILESISDLPDLILRTTAAVPAPR
jgi:phosphoglycolate phosphatase-like HAD superfamily hydrolase